MPRTTNSPIVLPTVAESLSKTGDGEAAPAGSRDSSLRAQKARPHQRFVRRVQFSVSR